MTGARTNPFSMDCLERLPFLFRTPQVPDWSTLFDQLHLLNCRAAIVGHHGTGKTQLLQELGRRLNREGYRVHHIFLNSQSRNLNEIATPARPWTSDDFILLDGSEQLWLWSWRAFSRLTRAAGGLVITSHRPGRLPTLYRCQSDLALLLDLLIQLGLKSPDRQVAERLFKRHRGNVRDTLRAYYDLAAEGRLATEATDVAAVTHPGEETH